MTLGRTFSHAAFVSQIGLVAALSCATMPTAVHAVNSVVVESKTFAPGQTACSVGVFLTNDEPLEAIVLPLELRSMSGGAYIAGPFPASFRFRVVPGNRIHNSPLGAAGDNWPAPISVTSYCADPRLGSGPQNQCSGPLSGTYDLRTQSVNASSPDGLFYAAISTGDPRVGEETSLQPGADPFGTADASFLITFSVSETQGCFRIDTCCIAPANHLLMVNIESEATSVEFTRGIVTVGEVECAGNTHPDSNHAPTARCIDSLLIELGGDCSALVTDPSSINDGSFDVEDGTNLAMAVRSAGPLPPGRHSVVLLVCDQDAACSACTTTVIVRDTMPKTVSIDPDSLYFYFTEGVPKPSMCATPLVTTTGCRPSLRVIENPSMLVDVIVTDRWYVCVDRAIAANTQNGLYSSSVVIENANGGHRDTLSVVIEIEHNDSIVMESGCDSVFGFALLPTGEPDAGAIVRALACIEGSWNCSEIPGAIDTALADGSFALGTHGLSNVRVRATNGFQLGVADANLCELMPTYVYTFYYPDASLDFGGDQPDTVPCIGQGFVRSQSDANTQTPIPSANVQLWDSYPAGSLLVEDSTDQFGHFGAWTKSGTLVVRADGHCPRTIEEFSCDYQSQIVTLEPIPFTESTGWPHSANYVSSNAEFIVADHPYQVQPGDVVHACDPQGIICGVASVSAVGQFSIRVMGDDVETPEDEGALRGDTITFWLNCRYPIVAKNTWRMVGVPLDESGEGDPSQVLPYGYALLQNYPNPFNAGTVISFDIDESTDWTLTIFNVMGQRVREFTGQTSAARVNVQWDGRSDSGQQLASGVYFYRLSAGEFVDLKKMLLVK